MSNFFFCYDVNLRNFLQFKKGINCICHGLHPKTHNDFWLYLITDDLQQGIDEFKQKMKCMKNIHLK